ncbi:MAG: phage minor head protein [bacterium]
MKLWEPKQRIERLYRKSLRRIASLIIGDLKENDSPETISDKLFKISQSIEFQRFAESIALKMVTHLFADNGRTWRQAAMANGRGREIYKALQKELAGKTGELLYEQVRRNAEIIKTLPGSIAEDVTAYVARETLKGRRQEEIAKEIAKKFSSQTKARADLIARTELSKTCAALNESRCRQLGLNWYIWRACGGKGGDGRTRYSHKNMSDVLINWNDPPAPEDLFPYVSKSGKRYRNTLGHYHAGCCPNCRCYAEPLIDLTKIMWPAVIYYQGRLKKVDLKMFKKISNM